MEAVILHVVRRNHFLAPEQVESGSLASPPPHTHPRSHSSFSSRQDSVRKSDPLVRCTLPLDFKDDRYCKDGFGLGGRPRSAWVLGRNDSNALILCLVLCIGLSLRNKSTFWSFCQTSGNPQLRRVLEYVIESCFLN